MEQDVNRSEGGFSFVELIVTLVILCLTALVGVTVVKFNLNSSSKSATTESGYSVAREHLSNLQNGTGILVNGRIDTLERNDVQYTIKDSIYVDPASNQNVIKVTVRWGSPTPRTVQLTGMLERAPCPASMNHAPTNATLSSSSVPKNSLPGLVVGSFAVTDADSGDSHALLWDSTKLDNSFFMLMGKELRVRKTLANAKTYKVFLSVMDCRGLTLADTIGVVVPEDLVVPSIAAQDCYVPENCATGTILDTIVATPSELTFALSNLSVAGALAIDPVTGVLTCSSSAPFNFEVNPLITATVTVSNAKGSNSAPVRVHLSNVNEPPGAITFTYSDSILNNVAVGTLLGNVAAVDPDAGDSVFTWAITGTGATYVAISSGFKAVTTKTTSLVLGTYNINITATDAHGLSSNRDASFRIVSSVPAVNICSIHLPFSSSVVYSMGKIVSYSNHVFVSKVDLAQNQVPVPYSGTDKWTTVSSCDTIPACSKYPTYSGSTQVTAGTIKQFTVSGVKKFYTAVRTTNKTLGERPGAWEYICDCRQ